MTDIDCPQGGHGLVSRAVITEIQVPRPRDLNVKPTPSPEHVRGLIADLLADAERHPAALLCVLALVTGCRGEACGAR
jgi:hypothetical protein